VPHHRPSLIRFCAALALCVFAGAARAEGRAGAAPPLSADKQLFALPLPPEVVAPTEAAFRSPPGQADPLSPPRGRSQYLALITREAERRGLPPAVADAVAMVESSYSPGAVGNVGEVGLMQLRPTTAAMLGYRGSLTGLFEPETNIQYGVAYLAEAWRLTGGQLCQTLMKYRAGHGEERMTQRSVEYCARARLHLVSIGSPLANAPVPPAVAQAVVSRPRSVRKPRQPTLKTAAGRAAPIRRSIWTAHDARFKAIQSKISSASLRIMQ
jgi:soluble lytic murein transglycosylase-like protein